MLKYTILTAGRAKNDIAKTAKHEATIFPIHVCGTLSPYPIVITVIFREKKTKYDSIHDMLFINVMSTSVSFDKRLIC